MAERPSHNVVVFLGPTLSRDYAERILPATYLPPARRGDFYRLQAAGIETIVLIDGYFHSTPSVWPREILDVINDGIDVLGASSMGALRAAELFEHGMVGWGTVFEWYRDGVIDGDDEVALWHGPEEAGYCALSEPLVNIRRTLWQAVDDGCLSLLVADLLIDYAKATYYPKRSYENLMLCPALKNVPANERASIERYLAAKRIDIKREDATSVLRHCAERTAPSRPTSLSEPYRPRSAFWKVDRLCATGFVVADGIALGEAVIEAAAHDQALVCELWERLGTRAFILDWGLHNGSSFLALEEPVIPAPRSDASWLRANGLSPRGNQALAAECALADRLIEDRMLRIGTAGIDGRRRAERSILRDWARQQGVTCPPSIVEGRNPHHEPGGPTDRGAPDVPALGSESEDDNLIAWMLAQGPRYFGLPWSFEAELIEELQRTGRASELLAAARQRG
jgi:hypothetical protein